MKDHYMLPVGIYYINDIAVVHFREYIAGFYDFRVIVKDGIDGRYHEYMHRNHVHWFRDIVTSIVEFPNYDIF